LMALAAGGISHGLRPRNLILAGLVLVPFWLLAFPGLWALLELAWSAA